MDIYLFGLGLGAVGLAAMGLLGHTGQHGHGGHDTGGHEVGHGHVGHGHGDAGHGDHGHGQAHGDSRASAAGKSLMGWLSPRVLFSVAAGFGATGLVARAYLAEPLLLGAAIVGGIAFEGVVMAPLWRLLFRFGSEPARTLESSRFSEARAVTGFNSAGEGLISLDLGGEIVQVLGTLIPEERGQRVRPGDRLMIHDVDAGRNRCSVSRIPA